MKLGFEIRQEFEEFPHEEEFPEILNSFPPEVVGYWHDFGHSQCKEFLGWHDHVETVRLRSSRLFGPTFTIAAVRRRTTCRSATARSPSARSCPCCRKRYRCSGARARNAGGAGHRQSSFMEFLRRRLGLILQVLVSALAIAWLMKIVDWSQVWSHVSTMDPAWIVTAIVCFAPVLLTVSWRWRMLLGVHGVHLSFWRIFELTMIGQFFSALGVGTTGGDVIKIFYAARAVPQRRSAVAFTILLDRVIGMVALLLYGVALSIPNLSLLLSTHNTKVATGTFISSRRSVLRPRSSPA